MKRSIAMAAGAILAIVLAAPAVAGPPITGSSTVPPTQPAGTTILVDVAIGGIIPVVPYEYSIQNECSWGKKATSSSYQRDDIIDWTFVDGGLPAATMPVYLQSIPEGAKCKVFLMRGPTQVKGSVSSYVVDAAT
jgi:hypothetical protein